jgi:hypothetical protein
MHLMPRRRLECPTYRLIPSHFPPIQLFENLLDAGELETAYHLESLTNDRIREEIGDIAMVPPRDHMVGPGTTPIMAAFTHIGLPSRFTNGRFGVYYAALDMNTALKESIHRRTYFLQTNREPAHELTLRAYCCRVGAELLDVRDRDELHHPDDYTAPQAFAAEARDADEYGIYYRSVRNTGGECIAALRPTAMVPPANQAGHYRLFWDGKAVRAVAELREIRL